jgi:hypothetical protein
VESTLEIIEEVTTLEIINGDETTVLEIEGESTIDILEIAEQGLPGADGGEGLAAVEDDPAPTLGGDLNLGAFNIIGQLENEAFILDGGLL